MCAVSFSRRRACPPQVDPDNVLFLIFAPKVPVRCWWMPIMSFVSFSRRRACSLLVDADNVLCLIFAPKVPTVGSPRREPRVNRAHKSSFLRGPAGRAKRRGEIVATGGLHLRLPIDGPFRAKDSISITFRLTQGQDRELDELHNVGIWAVSVCEIRSRVPKWKSNGVRMTFLVFLVEEKC